MGLPDYEIRDTIGVSARSLVRRGIRKADGAPVVIKSSSQLYPSQHELRQLEFEFHVLRRLDVPGVVKAIALEKDGGKLALVMEDFGGTNLPIGAKGADLGLLFDVAIQAARALGRVHDRNVIHKDIKPRNLLLNASTRTLKIIDFHVASELSHERQDVEAASQIQGSLPYMSPEQTGRMNRELDYRTDYYSLGATLFELATGRPPFEAADAMGYLHCHISKRAPLACRVNPALPLMLSEIISKLMMKDPDERYQSAHGLVADLERCREEWGRTGAIERFALGARDVSERFRVPQKLIGRTHEIGTLLGAFKEASDGQARLLLLGGPSGVGKTSLVQEIHRSTVKLNGHFISGKCDQLDRNVPYGALVRAIQKLVKQLLVEADDRLERWRSALTAALGSNAQVMCDLVPELQQIIGAQPPVAALGPTETQNRFRRVFRELIRVFARREHPLVIFLDDLQWIDGSTPELVADLFGGGEAGHLLLIGAYRDNEVQEGDLLSVCLKSLRARCPEVIRELALSPLPEAALNQLVAETLRRPEPETALLTSLLYEKTEGNPLYVNELLVSLHQEGAFVFGATQGRWEFNLDKVRQAAVSESVAELMVGRLQILPVEAQAVLKAAACVGGPFDLRTLAEVSELTVAQAADALWAPTQARIVIPLDGNYRLLFGGARDGDGVDLGVRFQFQHDRVRRAAYSLLAPEERARLHLKLGRLLLARSTDPKADEHIFDVVNHYDLAGTGLADAGERIRLVSLNRIAAARAKQSAAYAVAAHHLARAIDLADLAGGGAGLEASERFALHRERAECTFLAGEVEQAGALCEPLLGLATTPLAAAEAHLLKTRILEHQGRLSDAVATVRAALGHLGVDLPADPGIIDQRIGEGIGKLQAHLARVPVEQLADLPELTDPAKVMAQKLLYTVIPSAIQTYPPLFVLSELMMFDLALTFGTTTVSCKNFVDCGIIQGGILGAYDVAYRLGEVAFKMLERYRGSGPDAAVNFVFGTFISHWRRPFRETLDTHDRAYRLGLESGDVVHATYAVVHRIHRLLFVGENLDTCAAEAESAMAYFERAQAAGPIEGMRVVSRPLARLRGTDPDPAASAHADEEAAAALRAFQNAQWLYSYGQAQTMTSFLLGEVEAARRWQAFTEPFELAGNGLFSMADYHLFRALLDLEALAGASGDERTRLSARVGTSRDKLRVWAENCPSNFAHKHALLCAEIARVDGAPLEQVLSLYEQVIEGTGDDFIQLSALAHERQAKFWRETGHPKVAAILIREAYQLYAAWGARAKLRALEAEHPQLVRAAATATDSATTGSFTSSTGSASAIDLTSVLKATRAISSEVEPERLFARLMETIIENAGAERGCLIVRDESDQRYNVEAWAEVDADAQSADEKQPTPLDAAGQVCREVVRYVIRTGETVVLDDAAAEGPFQSDAYVQQNGIKSMLCMPVLNQSSLVAVLYAENNATGRAFTADRLDILRVIASQAAISITNALLYRSLETKVEERTAELAAKNREIAVMLNGMDQGVFTVDEELAIQPQYSRHLEEILGTSQIAGQSCLAMLFRDAAIRPDQMAAMEAALYSAFGSPAILAELNLEHAVREFTVRPSGGGVRQLEADWNLIVDEQEQVTKLLVALRDVTVLRQLKETAQNKARETDIVGQILDSGLEVFRQFCGSARALLHESRATLTGDRPFCADDRRALLRAVHTIKGNARLFSYTHLVDVVHGVEERYGAQPASLDRDELLAGVDTVLASVLEYEQVCEQKLRPLAGAHNARVEQAIREIAELVYGTSGDAHPDDAVAQIRSVVRRVRAVPLAELVKDTSRMLPSLAEELAKSVPVVECGDQQTVLSQEWAEVVRDVLVHAFRNALAHGIEAREERQAANKTPEGRLRVRAERVEAGLRIRLSDDGKGLPIDLLGTRTGRAGRADEEIADAVFSAGVSTSASVSRIAGRGVGMDVVRSAVRKLGGDVTIRFTGEKRAGHRPFELLVTLPPNALFN